MPDNFKTDALFVVDLPCMPHGESVRFHYADMADMPLHARKPDSAWDDTSWDEDIKFRGGTMAQAISLARHGWLEGAEQAVALHAGVQATIPTRRKLARYDVAGAVPSIPRALAGNPMGMRRMTARETAQRPIISLVCDICVSSSFPAEDMLRHAAAVAAVVDLLEESGFRCAVLVVARVTSRVNSEIVVCLKQPEQPLNLSVLAYGLGHPSMFRRLMFSVWQSEKDCEPLGYGLGSVHRLESAPELGTYTIGAASRAGDGVKAPKRFRHILRELELQGCPGIPEELQAA